MSVPQLLCSLANTVDMLRLSGEAWAIKWKSPSLYSPVAFHTNKKDTTALCWVMLNCAELCSTVQSYAQDTSVQSYAQDTSVMMWWTYGWYYATPDIPAGIHDILRIKGLPGDGDTQDVVIGRTHEESRFFGGVIDEVALFKAVLTEKDITEIMQHGIEKILGIAPVDPTGKLTTTWATIRAQN